MDWRKYWNELALASDNPFQQVARTGKKVDFSESMIQRIVDHISNHLQLQEEDNLLDVCCGNGLITSLLSNYCSSVVGCDISEELINQANAQFSSGNIEYVNGDAIQLSDILSSSFDKINLYFSFQYLDTYQKGFLAIREMSKLLKPKGFIFIGDVPDFEKLESFYPSYSTRLKYHIKQRLGKSEMGKFWKEKEIYEICKKLNLSYQKFSQPDDLPYSAYRVDYLIRK